ncbi:MAG: putative peptidyl-prolyl cis-trans isomerase [Candidatus Dichloromethanomonas elyunquensis]|nr:MAG: putative peptidyl-prolyl cis-trans isomerase [Candidatus Dichloromethanomonas elyunquensis]
MKKPVQIFFLVFLTIFSMFFVTVTGCSAKKPIDNPPANATHPVVQIEMQDGGKIVLELYPEYAPQTVQNFVSLAQSGFYNGLKFHRIMKGFMIQGGDPKGNGTGGSGKTIKGEFADNGFTQNTLKHAKGVISMARSSRFDSASSQFFIMDGDNSYLDGKYAAFGKLIEGESTLDKIADTPVEPNPNSPQRELSLPKIDVIVKEIKVLKNS